MSKETTVESIQTTEHRIHRGTLEGVVVIDGFAQMERADMPSISFASVEALRKATESLHRDGG